MSQDDLQQKLDQASRHYNDGSYDQAAAVWKEILQADPENEKRSVGTLHRLKPLASCCAWQPDRTAIRPIAAAPPPRPSKGPRYPLVGCVQMCDFMTGSHVGAYPS